MEQRSVNRSLAAVVSGFIVLVFLCYHVFQTPTIARMSLVGRLTSNTLDAASCGLPTDPPSSFNCSFNGACRVDGTCQCQTGWTGRYCQTLDLDVATNHSGLKLLGVYNTSTWGGSVLYDHKDGRYHMFASELSHHCGIHKWVSNSVVVHAVSLGASDGWKFSKVETVLGIFAHEPIVVRDPRTHQVGLFVTYYHGDASDCGVCLCVDGNSASGGCPHECGSGVNKTLFSYFVVADSVNGNWSNPISLCKTQMGTDDCKEGPNSTGNPHVDMNLAPIIHEDGSLLAWTRWHIWEATDWKDPETYVNTGPGPDFNSKPYPTPWEGEDPSIWRDRYGRYHMISHNGARGQTFAHNASGDCGRHYFSETGKARTWRVAPLLPSQDLGGCAYSRSVPFANGATYTFYRRERPHIILGPDGYTPVALSTGVIDSPVDDILHDASYTLVQPIRAR